MEDQSRKEFLQNVGTADAPEIKVDSGVKCRLCGGIHEMLYSTFPVCTRCADDLKAIIKERRNSKK